MDQRSPSVLAPRLAMGIAAATSCVVLDHDDLAIQLLARVCDDACGCSDGGHCHRPIALLQILYTLGVFHRAYHSCTYACPQLVTLGGDQMPTSHPLWAGAINSGINLDAPTYMSIIQDNPELASDLQVHAIGLFIHVIHEWTGFGQPTPNATTFIWNMEG